MRYQRAVKRICAVVLCKLYSCELGGEYVNYCVCVAVHIPSYQLAYKVLHLAALGKGLGDGD